MGNDIFNDEQLAHLKDRADEIERLRLALAEATRERDNWTETARTYAKGEDYYRGLIDAALKDDPAAYVADDGSISEDVLRAKLPEMYALAVTERKRAEAEFDRLRQDRYDALNAQTTEGLSAAEWQLRTGKAERERDEARAESLRILNNTDAMQAATDKWRVRCRAAERALSRARETEDGAVREALAPIRGLRITAAEIRAALKSVMPYGPGHLDESIVMVAASAAADSLAALSSPPRPGAEEASE